MFNVEMLKSLMLNKYCKNIKSSWTIFFTTKYFTYDNKKTRSTNTIKIVSTIDGVTTTYTREIGLSSRDTRTVSEGLSFTPTSKCIYLLNGVWQDNLSIKYSFIDYPSCLIPSYYHELCIDQLSITCSDYSMAKVTCKDINLVITNRNGVFNDLGGTSTSLILPLTLEFNGTTGKLKFKNTMYVDPTTLMMSSTKKSGYVATNHLYFPRNEMKYQGEYEFNVLFTNFGINKTSVSSKHTIKALINTLGDCYNSEYCIINNDAEINDLGWAI